MRKLGTACTALGGERYRAAVAISAIPLTSPLKLSANVMDVQAARGPSSTSAKPKPMGQLESRYAIATVISRPANQSATIFAMMTFSTTPPTPLTRREKNADQ